MTRQGSSALTVVLLVLIVFLILQLNACEKSVHEAQQQTPRPPSTNWKASSPTNSRSTKKSNAPGPGDEGPWRAAYYDLVPEFELRLSPAEKPQRRLVLLSPPPARPIDDATAERWAESVFAGLAEAILDDPDKGT